MSLVAQIAYRDTGSPNADGRPVSKRASDRFVTKMSVGVRRMGATRIPADVTDLSTSGCRIQAEERLPKDSMIWIKLGALAPITARVVWTDRLMAGCAFTEPLHPSVLQQLLQTS